MLLLNDEIKSDQIGKLNPDIFISKTSYNWKKKLINLSIRTHLKITGQGIFSLMR